MFSLWPKKCKTAHWKVKTCKTGGAQLDILKAERNLAKKN